VLPSTSDFSDVSESALNNPLPWDTVLPAPHQAYNRVEPFLPPLREASQKRIAAEKAFSFLADDIARLRKNLATKAVSLNEAERRAEIAENKARQAEREQQTKNLRLAAPAVYEITLANAASAGLPPAKSPSASPPSEQKKGNTAEHRATGKHSKQSAEDDILLNESEQILADYVGLLARKTP